jgi:hypothetical protein
MVMVTLLLTKIIGCGTGKLSRQFNEIEDDPALIADRKSPADVAALSSARLQGRRLCPGMDEASGAKHVCLWPGAKPRS